MARYGILSGRGGGNREQTIPANECKLLNCVVGGSRGRGSGANQRLPTPPPLIRASPASPRATTADFRDSSSWLPSFAFPVFSQIATLALSTAKPVFYRVFRAFHQYYNLPSRAYLIVRLISIPHIFQEPFLKLSLVSNPYFCLKNPSE